MIASVWKESSKRWLPHVATVCTLPLAFALAFTHIGIIILLPWYIWYLQNVWEYKGRKLWLRIGVGLLAYIIIIMTILVLQKGIRSFDNWLSEYTAEQNVLKQIENGKEQIHLYGPVIEDIQRFFSEGTDYQTENNYTSSTLPCIYESAGGGRSLPWMRYCEYCKKNSSCQHFQYLCSSSDNQYRGQIAPKDKEFLAQLSVSVPYSKVKECQNKEKLYVLSIGSLDSSNTRGRIKYYFSNDTTKPVLCTTPYLDATLTSGDLRTRYLGVPCEAK